MIIELISTGAVDYHNVRSSVNTGEKFAYLKLASQEIFFQKMFLK